MVLAAAGVVPMSLHWGVVHLPGTRLESLAGAGFEVDPDTLTAEDATDDGDIVAADVAGGVLLFDPDWLVCDSLATAGLPGNPVALTLAESTGGSRLQVLDGGRLGSVGQGEGTPAEPDDPDLLARLDPMPEVSTVDRYLAWFESLTGVDPLDVYDEQVWHRVSWPGMPG